MNQDLALASQAFVGRAEPACIGYANHADSFLAGKEAALAAQKRAVNQQHGLALAFCGGRQDYQASMAGMQSVLGGIPIIGGPAIGVITNEHLSYSGYEVGLALLDEQVHAELAWAKGLDRGERATGATLGAELAERQTPSDQLALLFYDSVRQPPPPAPVLNVSSYLLEGFYGAWSGQMPMLVGAGLIGTFAFDRGQLFIGDDTAEQVALGAVLSGPFAASTTIMHGCQPMSGYHRITRVEGPVVYEIDHQPALGVIDRLMGNKDWQHHLPTVLLTLGVNHGAKYAPYDEHNYVNRLIVSVIPETQAIVLFEADFANQSEFQFMRRSPELMVQSARQGCHDALRQLEESNREGILALYIDCAGRTAAFSGVEQEEAAIVQDLIGSRMPLLGCYSGVEIAPVNNLSRGLDWTGVLLILSRERP